MQKVSHLCGFACLFFFSQAQTEIFIRACSAVESKLEHVVEELKKDRFLGDAEWPVVWRYSSACLRIDNLVGRVPFRVGYRVFVPNQSFVGGS